MNKLDENQGIRIGAIEHAFRLGLLVSGNKVKSPEERLDHIIFSSSRDSDRCEFLLEAINTEIILSETLDYLSYLSNLMYSKKDIFTDEESRDILSGFVEGYYNKLKGLRLRSNEGNIQESFIDSMTIANRLKRDTREYFFDYLGKWIDYRNMFIELDSGEQEQKAV
ncbi:hypothetical protein J4477_00140 [Candidatus Pacearchaeota archaeon]|nr:hypothetical protein [Candidatus Pacearchaeota archaeon]